MSEINKKNIYIFSKYVTLQPTRTLHLYWLTDSATPLYYYTIAQYFFLSIFK